MTKTQLYLSNCTHAAQKSDMQFTLGAVVVKGGKILSSGYNHHRTRYDGSLDIGGHSGTRPMSMHAEMHAIFNATRKMHYSTSETAGAQRSIRVLPRIPDGEGAVLPSDGGPAGGTAWGRV